MAGSGGEEEVVELYVRALLVDGITTRQIRLVPAWESFSRVAVASEEASPSRPARPTGGSPASPSRPATPIGGPAASASREGPLPAVEKMTLIMSKGGEAVATLELAPAAHDAGARGAAGFHVSLQIDSPEGQATLRLHRNDGTGSEGNVYQCHSLLMGAKFSAVKEVSQAVQILREPNRKNCEPCEVKILSLLNHVGIVRLYQAWTERESIYIGMKLCQRTLRACLKDASEGVMENGKFICIQIAKAVEFMHGKGVVHRDIKPSNLLLDGLIVRLADYGLAVRKEAEQSDFSGGCYGTVPYRAPELISTFRRHNEKVDIFSIGMIYYELFVPGNKRKANMEQLNNIIGAGIAECDPRGLVFDLDEYLHKNATDIFEGWQGEYRILMPMLRTEPSERPSALQILDLFDVEKRLLAEK